jgi:hypothetical protein
MVGHVLFGICWSDRQVVPDIHSPLMKFSSNLYGPSKIIVQLILPRNIIMLATRALLSRDVGGPFPQCNTFAISGRACSLLDLSPIQQQGACDVDLALRLDVLAVLAVFAFVGAIVLGAF